MPFTTKLNSLFSRRWRRRKLIRKEEDPKCTSNDTDTCYLPVEKRWRNCSDFDSWVRATYPYFYLDGACIRDFKVSYNPPDRGFPEWLQHRAEEYMKTLQELLQKAGIKGMKWFEFPVADKSADKLIWLLGLLLRETPHMPPLDSHRIYHCYNILRDRLSEPVLRADSKINHSGSSERKSQFLNPLGLNLEANGGIAKQSTTL